MNYKISFETEGAVDITALDSQSSMPIKAYAAGRKETNTVYCVVTQNEQQRNYKRLRLRVLDMRVKPGMRGVYLDIYLDTDDSRKMTIYSNLGTLHIHNEREIRSQTMEALIKMIWTRSAHELFLVLREAQFKYCNEGFKRKPEHSPWLKSLNKKEATEVVEAIKKQLSQ